MKLLDQIEKKLKVGKAVGVSVHAWLNGQDPHLQATKELWSSANTCFSNTTTYISNWLLTTKAIHKPPSLTLCTGLLFIRYVRARPVGC